MTQKQRILIIDDDPELSRMIGFILQKSGYEVETAHNGKDGLAKADEVRPDLIVLDVMMPDMSGIEVCQKLRDRPVTRSLPIIMLSALADIDAKLSGFQVGADDYIPKPVNAKELIARIQALLLRARVKPPTSARTIAMIGAKGGIGVTTTAVNIGAALAKQDKNTVLFDCRSSGGTLTHQLRLKAETDFSNLLTLNANQIRRPEIERCFVKHASGLNLLMSPLNAQKQELTVGHVETIFDTLATRMDFIILDLPPMDTPYVRRALELADQVLLFTEPDTFCVRCARHRISQFKDWGTFDRANLVVITRAPMATKLNRVEIENQAGVGDTVVYDEPSRLTSVVTVSHRSIRGVVSIIPTAPEIFHDAARERVPIVLTDPNARPARALLDLADWLVDDTKQIDTRQYEMSY
ncbi:MAG: response regulator [Ardenticatenaceae bacterium]|nr:response regulator [Ardenticatenaceae bacterium]